MKKFPIKDLLLKVSAVIALFVAFKVFFVQTHTKSIQVTNNKPIQKKIVKIKKPQEKTLELVEKLNTYIEEQRFLLTMLEEDNPSSNNLINDIEKTLNEIEQEAKEKDIQNLIDNPQISELRNNLATYKQIIKHTKQT